METESVLNTLDYIVIFVILLSAALAAMRGFVREFVSLVAWIGAYIVGTNFYGPAIPIAHHFVKSPKVGEWLAMAIMFTGVLIVLLIAGYFVSKLVKGQVLTTIDRSLGFLYGLARGALVVCLVYLTAKILIWPDINMPPEKQAENEDRHEPPALLVKAKTRPVMEFGANVLMQFVPKDMIGEELKRAEGFKNHDLLSTPSKDDTASPEREDNAEKSPVDIDKLFRQENAQ
ncbi:MAG: CvpA family protein [Alphaproteobacteria bacterium]|nr:CvpA family protein [Alphaproteobacteria bacterium]